MSDAQYHIQIDVATQYVPERSGAKEYFFAYTVTITNTGSIPARLLSRHWVITDANGKVQEVRGEGVVGEKPYLKPGQGFRYTSAATIPTPVGSMHGAYTMEADDGYIFDAPIAPFSLAQPNMLH
jgi:ApaG protein